MFSLEKRTITGSFCIKLVNKKIKNNFEHVLYPLHIKSEEKTYIGYKSELKEGVAYVSQVWCKVCASNKGKLYERHAVKGATKTAAESFANGTDFATKHLVQIFDFDRHCFL